jgi:hypothetical protein
VIADFADEVEGLAGGIGGDANADNDIPGIVNSQLGCSYLRLLPPMEMHGMAVGVGRL